MLFCKSEVCDNGPPIVEKNVGQFEVAVQEPPLCDLDEPSHDVPGQLHRFPFAHLSLLFEQSTEVAPVAKVGHDEAVTCLPNHVVTFQDVAMLQLGQSLDFAI